MLPLNDPGGVNAIKMDRKRFLRKASLNSIMINQTKPLVHGKITIKGSIGIKTESCTSGSTGA